jgi:hypothetical protein
VGVSLMRSKMKTTEAIDYAPSLRFID